MRFEVVRAIWAPYRARKIDIDLSQSRVNALGGNRATTTYIGKNLQAVESKSGVLLTHISMMIAVTGIMYSIGRGNPYYEAALALELMCYLLLALFCIRCQYQFDLNDFKKIPEKQTDAEYPSKTAQFERAQISELIFKEFLFRWTLYSLYLLTIVLIITITIGVVFGKFNIPSGYPVTPIQDSSS